MSKVRARTFNLVSTPLSEEEHERRRLAEGRRTGLIGGLNGQLFEPAPKPTQAPRETGWEADPETLD
jgi:hypothetical protein